MGQRPLRRQVDDDGRTPRGIGRADSKREGAGSGFMEKSAREPSVVQRVLTSMNPK